MRVRVYNRGEDDHDLAVVDQRGAVAYVVSLKPGETERAEPREPARQAATERLLHRCRPGRAESHEDRGMSFVLDVR